MTPEELVELNELEELNSLESEIGSEAPQQPYEAKTIPTKAMQSVGKAAMNFPSSTMDLARGAFDAFTSPKQTMQNMGDLVGGLVSKGGMGNKMLFGDISGKEQVADSFIDSYKDRYGGLSNIQNTFENDPAGMLSDISGMGVVAPAKMGAALRAIDPLNAIANKATKIASKIPKPFSSRMMESATNFDSGIEPHLVSADMVERRIVPSLKGVRKVNKMAKKQNATIAGKIDQADSQGWKFNPESITAPLDDLRQEYGSIGKADRRGNIRAINKVERQFLHGIEGEKMIPSELQSLKKDYYDKVNYSKNPLAPTDPMVAKAQKVLGQSAKTHLENIMPSLKPLNKEYGKLLTIKKHLPATVHDIRNRRLMQGVNMLGLTGAGHLIAPGAGGAMIGLGLSIFDQPAVKSRAAILMNEMAKKTPTKALLQNRRLPLAFRQNERALEEYRKR